MNSNIRLSAEHVSKTFRLPHEQYNSLKSTVLNLRRTSFEQLQVLEDISFEIRDGEFFGIVGRNGSGKSTLLKMIAGIYQPTSGSFTINGRLTPFIELGVGFNMELTGRDNIYLNGAILGLTKKEVDAKYQQIVDFAELEKFMDQKLKNYSSGMQVRLAFSIAIQAHSEILLVDEVLAVGDANFQRKCFDVFKRIKREGKTVIFVSHAMGAVQEYCDRAMLINRGKIVSIDRSDKIANAYNSLNTELSEQELDQEDALNKSKSRWGTGDVKIETITTQLNGKSQHVFGPHDSLEVSFQVKAHQPVTKPVYGITIRTIDGNPLFATNSRVLKVETDSLKKGETRTVRCSIKNVFNDGSYLISPAVASSDLNTFYDWWDDACTFRVTGWPLPYGLVQPQHTMTVGTK